MGRAPLIACVIGIGSVAATIGVAVSVREPAISVEQYVDECLDYLAASDHPYADIASLGRWAVESNQVVIACNNSFLFSQLADPGCSEQFGPYSFGCLDGP